MSSMPISLQRLVPAGFFALRTPLLPLADLVGWGDPLTAEQAEAERLAVALQNDRVRLRTAMRAWLDRPEIRDALFIASPTLEQSADLWRREPDSERGRKVELALVRYFERMSGRPTPFGLFAGCSVGRLGPTTRLTVEARSSYRRHTRLDMHYVSALTEALAARPSLRARLRYRPSSILYRAGGRLRYVEPRTKAGSGERTYHLVSVEPTPYLAETLERARAGATPSELAAPLVDENVSLDEAQIYVETLIDCQLLVSDIDPAITGPSPVEDLVTTLRSIGAENNIADTLVDVAGELSMMDAEGLGAAPARYRAVGARLGALPCQVELARLFQVDMVKPAPGATLGQSVVGEVARGIELLWGIQAWPSETGLDRFRRKFHDRYGDREVHLLDALDEEIGIGIDGETASGAPPLLDGLGITPPGASSPVELGPSHALLMARLSEAIATGCGEIALSSEDIDILTPSRARPLPSAVAAIVQIQAVSDEALALGDYRFHIRSASGPSGANLLGRFCHADEELHREVIAHLREEESRRPDAVFAEIVHLPEGRIGNILSHPVLRAFEIPFLGRGGAPPRSRIPLADLFVSVRRDRVVLRSRRLGREVIPCLTHAHNFARADLGIYRFLCMLSMQDGGGVTFEWAALEQAPTLPRVVFGRQVLSLATWRLDRQELASLGHACPFEAARALRERRRLPRLVTLTDGDNRLPVDFANVLSVEAFAAVVRNRADATLQELFPGPEALCVQSPEGRFTHELVVPYRLADPLPEPAPPPAISVSAKKRTFLPGSEWLYLKLYTGAATADRVLQRAVGPLVRDALGKSATRWFFLRYGDPDWHIRLRILGDPDRLIGELLPALHAAATPLESDGSIWKVQVDTYEREVERYGGGEAVELAERLFMVDSEAVLRIVEMLEGDEGADARWRLALKGIDLMLDDLGLDLEAKRQLLAEVRDVSRAEFAVGAATNRELDRRFRVERPALETLLDHEHECEPLADGIALLRGRSAEIHTVAAAMRELHENKRLTVPIPDLAKSFVHMHANRLLSSDGRAQELVLYDFLHRLCESRAARRRRKGVAP